ncbi:MAG: DUF2520 domain-containing protein [Betaproteobacteria bacterium]|nr:DUF2520 domain-containing protein [Betaproteobacteria bacterium]
MTEKIRIGFIGAGRVAKALTLAFSRAGESVVAVASRTRASAEACASIIPGCEIVEEAQQVLDCAQLVFLAVPDDTIATLVSDLHWRVGVMVVHCSGATGLSALEPARAAGAQIGSFHPLLMFADREVAARALPRSAIALEAEEPLLGLLEDLVRKLGAQSLFVPPAARTAYHAASHYGAAFLCVLLDQGMKILDAGGMRGEDSSKALLSLARSTLAALEHSDPAHAMAGVFARGDAGTARQHLQALDAIDPAIASLYRELARCSIALARGADRIDQANANALQELLR